MAITRKFFDWRRPALAEAVQFLIERYASGERLDLSQAIVVLPGSRAARRLLELLVEAAGQRRWSFTPGDILTIGQLPELLYSARRPLANELTQRAAWGQALREIPRDDLLRIAPFPPPVDDALAWLELGDLLRREHLELAGDGLDFAHVADTIAELNVPRDVERWRSLARVQAAYHRVLDAVELWDRQTARLVAVQKQECHVDRDIVLLGTVDMNRTLRAMLDAVADRVTALVPAPPDTEASPPPPGKRTRRVKDRSQMHVDDTPAHVQRGDDRFDGHGCLVPSRWQDWSVELADAQLHLVERPPDQAVRVADCLAAYDGRYNIEEITIGIPDEDPELIAQIERQLAERGVIARWGPGRTILDSLPVRLLTAVADYLRTGSRPALAALVRHPDVCDWLALRLEATHGRDANWLAHLDDYLASRLPQRVAPPWLGKDAVEGPVAAAYGTLTRLLAPLQVPDQPLHNWDEPLRGLLLDLYGAATFALHEPAQRATWRALEAIEGALAGFDSVPTSLAPQVSAADALGLVLQALSRESIPSAVDEPAVELLGWLELPLDDAPALVVTSFNDGIVPKAVNADPFLPNAIRARLGLDDNDRRYARDAYALAVLRASRRSLDLVVGQRTSDGDPLSPSRLLLTGDPETILSRVQRLFRNDSASPAASPSGGGDPTSENALAVPSPAAILARERWLERRPGVVTPLTELSVTQFKSYLACPYRFFLQQVLKLRSASDEARELDPLAFGSLLHDVLRHFGAGDRRHSTDPEAIQAELSAQLDRLASIQYGARPLPAVRVQVEQIRLRLARFAEVHAEWIRQGWRIHRVEGEKEALRTTFNVDGAPFTLVGRIDRIDRHETTGAFAILDYKTSKAGDPPRKTHLRSNQWVDLQLPLYRHLAKSAEVDGAVSLGYVLLPADPARAGVALADWDAAELDAADETARAVVRNLRRLSYEPRSLDIDADWDEFAGICQTGVLGARP